MDIVDATQEYEDWLAAALGAPLDSADLDYKHRLLADPVDPFPFFRGTYYRWAQHWLESAGPLAEAPRVLAVGDLHVENFGTWRDADGRLCWGVNDFDEADQLPYTNDLVRLAASVRFARRSEALDLKLRDVCSAILDGYARGMVAGGEPFVLEEQHPHLRAMAMAADREPLAFWEKMNKLLRRPEADPPRDAREALDEVMPARGLAIAYRARPRAGVGSLGRARYVALAQWAGGAVCREAKAAAPPASAWAAGITAHNQAAAATSRAIRAADPFYRPGAGWVARRLAPRSSRIELSNLSAADAGQVLTAMGAEVANVHLGTPGAAAAVLADLAAQPAGWLADAARSLSRPLEADWLAWRAAKR